MSLTSDSYDNLKIAVTDLLIIGTRTEVNDLAGFNRLLETMDSENEHLVLAALRAHIKHLRINYEAKAAEGSKIAAKRLKLSDQILELLPE